ncbi:MAG: hypothetical protein KGI27_13065 [Thaumarchaeota archaeon]|nr:hypothetical protein [Nitrososphaerota archaeon]
MKARFDDMCKTCGLEIKAGEHEITNDDSGISGFMKIATMRKINLISDL